jgi:hypothetical protein
MKAPIARPYAIAMWDFSWLERRWPGAGYEDWDRALDELGERGYDAVRIDAYPHLASVNPRKTWDILPVWDQMSWGAPSLTRVQIFPALNQFIQKAKARGIKVALSTWYRQDRDDLRLTIKTPRDQARIWLDTLKWIEEDGLIDALLYVDLCNEFPIPMWTPYLYGGPKGDEISRATERMTTWMRDSIAPLKAAYPQLDYTFSFCTQYDDWREQDVSMLDFLEPHVWMAVRTTSDFYDKIDYHHELFDPRGFNNLVKSGYTEYMTNRAFYDKKLIDEIDNMAAWSRASGKPLITTECWSLVDYKDWPLLDWGWIKDLCEMGVLRAADAGRWVAIATSNFCGPQFHGMWRDVAWHRRLTDAIKAAPIDRELRNGVGYDVTV